MINNKNIVNTSGTSKYLPDPTWTKCPVLFMINWEKFMFIPRSALGHYPLTFLCSEISGWVLHLSVALVQPSPRDKRWDGHIVMVLTFCGTVNIAARAWIRSTSFFTTWNCQRDLCRVIWYTAVSTKVVQQNRTRQCRKVLWVMGFYGIWLRL